MAGRADEDGLQSSAERLSQAARWEMMALSPGCGARSWRCGYSQSPGPVARNKVKDGPFPQGQKLRLRGTE